MASYTKPEVQNVSQRRQRRTEPRRQATCTKIGVVQPRVFKFCERTDRQTDILITILCTRSDYRKPKQSYRLADPLDDRVTFTFDLLTSESVHSELSCRQLWC